MERIANRIKLVSKYFPKDEIGIELGTHQGDFAEVLLRETQPKTLYLVDNFTVTIQEVTGQMARARLEERFRKELDQGKVRLIVEDTFKWLSTLPASFAKWAYVDATHEDFWVYRELCQLLRVVEDGGWVGGHDYCCVTPGVVTAVDRFCLQHGQTLAYVTDEPEFDLNNPRPDLPKRAAFNSFAIQVSK